MRFKINEVKPITNLIDLWFEGVQSYSYSKTQEILRINHSVINKTNENGYTAIALICEDEKQNVNTKYNFIQALLTNNANPNKLMEFFDYEGVLDDDYDDVESEVKTAIDFVPPEQKTIISLLRWFGAKSALKGEI